MKKKKKAQDQKSETATSLEKSCFPQGLATAD